MNNSNIILSQTHRAALFYADKFKWQVFPVSARGKAPLCKHGVKEATNNPSVIAEWWRRWPYANIGLATGQSSKVVVLDIDAKPDAEEALFQFEKKYCSLPPTPHVKTGGSGFHFYFHTSERMQNKIGLEQGIDFKGDGGYVILPPSTHASGKTYDWEICHHINEMPISPLPEWLKDLLNIKISSISSNGTWAKLDGYVAHGTRNQTMTQIIGHLLRRYVDPDLVTHIALALNDRKFRPTLEQEEILKIIDSIAGLELKRRQERIA